MNRPVGIAASFLACAAVYLFAPVASQAQDVVSVRRVQVLGKQNPVEIEIEASDRLVPQAQILTNPDRLVVGGISLPGPELRRPMRDRAARRIDRRQYLLSLVSRAAAGAAGLSGHRRDDHCQPVDHHRRLFDDATGNPARLATASAYQADIG